MDTDSEMIKLNESANQIRLGFDLLLN